MGTLLPNLSGRNRRVVKMMKLLIISVLVAVATCKVIRTRSCLKASEKVNALKIHKAALEPCNSNPCILKRGGSTELQISFTATQDEPDFTDVCHGKVGFWVPFPLSKDHACREQGVCPIKAGESKTYKYGIQIASVSPPLRVPVRWELKRADGTRAFCEEFLTQLKQTEKQPR